MNNSSNIVLLSPLLGEPGYNLKGQWKHDYVTVLRNIIQCLQEPQLKENGNWDVL